MGTGNASSYSYKKRHNKLTQEDIDNHNKSEKFESWDYRLDPKKKTLNDYLASLGLSDNLSGYMDDKTKLPHGLTERQMRAMQKEGKSVADSYYEQREAAIAEYNELVANGEIIKPTNIETALVTAHGDGNNSATLAARRSLAKRGVYWRTGERVSLPDGMTRDFYADMIDDGWTHDEAIKKWRDMQQTRANFAAGRYAVRESREITSQTYERAVRNQERDLNNWFRR